MAKRLYAETLCGSFIRILLCLFPSVIPTLCPAKTLTDENTRYDSIINASSDKSLSELTVLGYKSLENDEYDKALTLYTLAISKGNELLTGTQMREYIKALNNIGYIYLFDRCNPEKAYPYLLHARRLAEKSEEADLLAATLDNIAKIHDDFGDYEKAIDLYNLAMSHAVRAETEVSPVIQLMVLNDMINCAMAHNMTDSIGRSLDSFAQLPEYSIPLGRYSKVMCRGLRLLLEGNLQEATNVIGSAQGLIDSRLDSARYVTDHNLTMANLYYMRRMEDSAHIYLGQALATALHHQLPDRLPRIYRGLSAIEAARGDSVVSRRMSLLAYEADEQLHTSKMYAALNTLEATQQIDNLNIRLREADIRHRHRVTIIWILTIAVILVAALLTYIFIRNRHLAASLRELVARYRASVNADELNTRLRHEYEETITALRQQLDTCNQAMNITEDNRPKGITLPVDDKERLRIIGEVTEIFNNSEETCNPDFSLDQLAELTSTKPRYLSALLNDTMGKSFSVLLAEARVKRACELLLSADFKKTKTIESIAFEVGYRSRTHFTSVFKKITGVTPLQYVAMAV